MQFLVDVRCMLYRRVQGMQIPYRSESGSSCNKDDMKADLWAGGRPSTPESIDSRVGVDDFET